MTQRSNEVTRRRKTVREKQIPRFARNDILIVVDAGRPE
jgi:hypothetical protein